MMILRPSVGTLHDGMLTTITWVPWKSSTVSQRLRSHKLPPHKLVKQQQGMDSEIGEKVPDIPLESHISINVFDDGANNV